jgi:hypothetical protein
VSRIVIETLAEIDAPKTERHGRFCAGVVLWDDKVVEVAPIVRFMKGWSRDNVRRHCVRKGWAISVVTETKRSVG